MIGSTHPATAKTMQISLLVCIIFTLAHKLENDLNHIQKSTAAPLRLPSCQKGSIKILMRLCFTEVGSVSSIKYILDV